MEFLVDDVEAVLGGKSGARSFILLVAGNGDRFPLS